MLQTTYLHSGWEFAESTWPGGKVATVQTGWLPATVPGHVHLDLVENGVIAHPFERMNELGCQWVDQRDWSYRTEFQWEATVDLPYQVLRFEGLDTICEIYLNGTKVGEHDNMFVPLEIKVTDLLLVGSNELRIDFKSAVRVGTQRREDYFAQEGLSLETVNFDERAFVRKAQYMFGWDWSPRLVSCGVWRPISLVEYSARITDVWVQQVHAADGSVELKCQIESEGDADGWILHGFDPEGILLDEPTEYDGGQSLHIPDPILWNPKDPQLYDVSVALASANPEAGAAEDNLLVHHVVNLNVGLAQKKLLRERDSFGESFEFEVNGKTLWARGANWIPDHSFPSYVTKEQYRDRLAKAKDMGFNMLRVWGGGLYETDEFYDICDELGILVWQDFAFACSYYPDDIAAQEVIRAEAKSNIKRIRNHPCLALWCGNNENLEMFANTWGGKDRNPKRYYGVNHYDNVLPELLAELDPTNSYISTSPIGTNPDNDGKAEKQTGPNSGGFGDQHCWDVWHGRGDWKYYADSTGRFSSEYGFASSCSASLWEQTLDSSDWDPHSKVVQWHDRTGKGHDTFQGYAKLHYPESVTLEDWVYYSQLNQRDALRAGVEHYRRSQFCRGSLIWQLNDCWPVQSWAILDSAGDYKALAYDLRRTYEDRLLSIERKNDQITVHAVNDSDEPWITSVYLSAVNLQTGEVLSLWESDFALDEDMRGPVLEASVHGLSLPDVLLTVTDGYGEVGSWQLLAEPKNARFAQAEPLIISTWNESELTIRTTTPLVDLMLTEAGAPTPFIDNFVTIPRPGVFSVPIHRIPNTIEARSLAGIHPIKVTRSPL